MAYGLQIYNSSGVVRMSLDDETSKVVGPFTGTGGSDSFPVTLTGEPNADGADSPLKYGIMLAHENNFRTGTLDRDIVIGTGANVGKAIVTGYNGLTYDFYLIRIEGS